MKSQFFKGIAVKSLILASALAFVNCDDSTSPSTNDDPIVAPGSSTSVDPTVDPVVDPTVDPSTNPVANSSAAAADPSQNPVVDPVVGSSASADPTVGPADPTATSSSAANPVVDPVVASSSATTPAATSSSATTTPAVASSSSVAPAVSSSSAAPVPSSSSVAPEAPKGIYLSTDTDENKNYMEVEYKTNTGADGGAILSYPKRMSDTQKHGIVIWGPGGGTAPGAYEGMIRRLASHGFVVIALSSSPGDASKAIPALDWLEKQAKDSNSPLYNKLDFTKVGASGHSMGGLESEQVLIKDSRVITAVMNNSGDLGGGAAQYVPSGKSIALVYGEVGSEAPNAEKDYQNNVKVPACLIKMEGNNFGHGSGPWDGMALTVSWMRWQLGGEDFRKSQFVGSNGAYINGSVPGTPGHYKGQCKNF